MCTPHGLHTRVQRLEVSILGLIWGVSLGPSSLAFGLPIIRPFKVHLVIRSHFKGKGIVPFLFFLPFPAFFSSLANFLFCLNTTVAPGGKGQRWACAHTDVGACARHSVLLPHGVICEEVQQARWVPAISHHACVLPRHMDAAEVIVACGIFYIKPEKKTTQRAPSL